MSMKATICIMTFLLTCLVAFSQMRLNTSLANDTLIHSSKSVMPLMNIFNAPVNRSQNTQAIPLDFYAQHLGFFCRQELKMQQVHVPVTFRVGSIDQCNYLEQKPGYKIN